MPSLWSQVWQALLELVTGPGQSTEQQRTWFQQSGWLQRLEQYGIDWEELEPIVARARQDPLLKKLGVEKFFNVVLQWVIDKKRSDYSTLLHIVRSWGGKMPKTVANRKLMNTVSAMTLGTPAFNPKNRNRYNISDKYPLPLAVLNDKRLAANRKALLNAAGNNPTLVEWIKTFALTAANLRGKGSLANLTKDQSQLMAEVQAVMRSLTENGFDPDQIDELAKNLFINKSHVQAEAAALGLNLNKEANRDFAKRTSLRKKIAAFRKAERNGLELPNLKNSEKVNGKVPLATLMWAKVMNELNEQQAQQASYKMAVNAGILKPANNGKKNNGQINGEPNANIRQETLEGILNYNALNPIGKGGRSQLGDPALAPEAENGIQKATTKYTHGIQTTPFNPLGPPGPRHPNGVKRNTPNLARRNSNNPNNLNSKQRAMLNSLEGGAAKGSNGGLPSLASMMGMGVGVNGSYTNNKNGSFRFANSIRHANAPTGNLNSNQYGDMLRHMVVTCNHYRAGSLNVDFHFANNETLRQARVALYKAVQENLFEKLDVLRKMCGDGVSSDDSAYKMLMRMGRITGEEKLPQQSAGNGKNGARKAVGALSVTLLPKNAGKTKGVLKGTAQLFPYPASLGQPNARLGVLDWTPLIVRFLEAGDQMSGRAAHVFSRLAVCNRLPNFPMVYGVGMATRSNGKKAIMVMQEAVHGTLSDWLRDKSPHVSMVALAMTQVLLALAAVHGRGMQHGGLSASSVQFLRSRRASTKVGQWSQYRVGNRDIYLTRTGDHFMLDLLTPSIRRRVGPNARHCEVAQVIRMFKSALVAGGAGEQYKQLMAMVTRNRPDAVMFLHNPETVELLQSLSARLVMMGSGKKVTVGRAYAFDVVPQGYKPYTGSPKIVCEGASLFTKVRAALNQL